MTHFYNTTPASVAGLTNLQAVSEYRRRADVPRDAIEGLTAAQLNAFPVPGTWSIQQIIVHLMETDLIASYRMKRIIAEHEPRIDVYDENAFAANLGCERFPIVEVCEVFRLNRRLTATVLEGLDESAFERVALHPEIGRLSLGNLLRAYVQHVDHHIAFAEKKRAMLVGDRTGS